MENKYLLLLTYIFLVSCSTNRTIPFYGFNEIKSIRQDSCIEITCNNRTGVLLDNELHLPVKYYVKMPLGLKRALSDDSNYGFYYPDGEFIGICTDSYKHLYKITPGDDMEKAKSTFSRFYCSDERKFRVHGKGHKRKDYLCHINDSSFILFNNIKEKNIERYKKNIIESYKVLELNKNDIGLKYNNITNISVVQIDSLPTSWQNEKGTIYIIHGINKDSYYKILSCFKEDDYRGGEIIKKGDLCNLSLCQAPLIKNEGNGMGKVFYHGIEISEDAKSRICYTTDLNGLYYKYPCKLNP